jgi:hypothetical protein
MDRGQSIECRKRMRSLRAKSFTAIFAILTPDSRLLTPRCNKSAAIIVGGTTYGW